MNEESGGVFQLWEVDARKAKVCQLFRMWNERLLRGSYAHFRAAVRLERFETALTVTNLAAAISVLFFSSNLSLVSDFFELAKLTDADQDLSYLVPVLSLLVVLSSAFQYLMQFSTKAKAHRSAGNEFANLRRKMERYWTKDCIHPEAIHSLNRAYNMISRSPPLVRDRLWEEAIEAKQPEVEKINSEFFTCVELDEMIINGDV